MRIPKPLADDFRNRWRAFEAAAAAAGIPPFTNPEILAEIETVFALSEFVSASCTREPALLADLMQSGD